MSLRKVLSGFSVPPPPGGAFCEDQGGRPSSGQMGTTPSPYGKAGAHGRYAGPPSSVTEAQQFAVFLPSPTRRGRRASLRRLQARLAWARLPGVTAPAEWTAAWSLLCRVPPALGLRCRDLTDKWAEGRFLRGSENKSRVKLTDTVPSHPVLCCERHSGSWVPGEEVVAWSVPTAAQGIGSRSPTAGPGGLRWPASGTAAFAVFVG